jgi:hypothetical protein
MEVLAARFEVARFAAKSLGKDTAYAAYDKLLALPKLSSGKIIDAVMECARVASFYSDTKKNGELVDKVSYKMVGFVFIGTLNTVSISAFDHPPSLLSLGCETFQ